MPYVKLWCKACSEGRIQPLAPRGTIRSIPLALNLVWTCKETASLCICLIISWTSKGLECMFFSKLRKWLFLLVIKGSAKASLVPLSSFPSAQSALALWVISSEGWKSRQPSSTLMAVLRWVEDEGGWSSSCSLEVAAAFVGSKIIIQVWFCFQRPSPPPDVDYPLDGEKILHVVGPIRWEVPWQNICYYKDIFQL